MGALLRTIAKETTSQMALRSCSEEIREEPGNTGVFAETKNVVEDYKITANHKKQASQVNDFSDFPCMGRCKSLGSLNLFLRYVS